MLRVLVIVISVCFIACTQTPRPAQPDPGAPADQQVLSTFEDLAAQVGAVREDCDAVATTLTTWTDANRASYPDLAQRASEVQLADEERLRHEDRLRAAMTTIIDAVASCNTRQSTQAAFTSFDVLVDPQ